MPKIDLEKLLDLEAKAFSAPWFVTKNGNDLQIPGFSFSESEYLLIDAMRNSIRELCLELKAARKVCEAAKELVRRKGGFITDLKKALEEMDGEP